MSLGFVQCSSDPCLFTRVNDLGVCFILSYIDDNAAYGDEAADKHKDSLIVDEMTCVSIRPH